MWRVSSASCSHRHCSPRQTPRGELIPIFDAYDQGRYADAIAALMQHPNLKTFAAHIAAPREASAWIAAASGAGVDRRRLIVATVALEAVNRHGLRQWGEAMVLLEWACALARRNVPSPAELAWHRASFALVQGGAADSMLMEVHVGHAFKRFPTDSQVILARAVARELRTFPDPRDGSAISDRDERVEQVIDYLRERDGPR